MIVQVGGGGRGSGKTKLIEQILRLTPDLEWIAIKFSPHGSHHGGPDSAGLKDTERYLAAGARRSFLLSVNEAEAALQRLLVTSKHILVESSRDWNNLPVDLLFLVPGTPAGSKATERDLRLRRGVLVMPGGVLTEVGEKEVLRLAERSQPRSN